MSATVSNYEDIYDEHGISPLFRPYFDELANEGAITNAEFGLRLATCINYKACAAAIMGRMSQPYQHLFNGLQPNRPAAGLRFVPHDLDDSDELTILPFQES